MRRPEIIFRPEDGKSSKYKDFLYKVSDVLKRGEIVVAPTDTIYGLLAHSQKKKAIVRVQKIKGRNAKKPMPILVHSFKQAEGLGKFSTKSKKLAKRLWPGPYTIVVNRRKNASGGVVFPGGSIGLRVPKNKWLRELIKITGAPLVATSANPAAKKEAKTIIQAIKYFSNARYKPDLFIDGGLISKKPSTIIDCRIWPPVILRGKLSEKLKAQSVKQKRK